MINVSCPVCKRSMPGLSRADWPQFPFCSQRCRLIDLGRWLGETYALRPEAEAQEPAPSSDEYSIP